MMTRRETQDGEVAIHNRLERLLELLGACSATVLTGRPLEEATSGELTPVQLEALAFIDRHDGCSAKALSEGLGISIPSSTRLVDRLVRKRLVDRRESGIDRRLVELTVTPVGASALCDVRKARVARLEAALLTLSDDERTTLLNLFERFLRAAMRDERSVRECCRHCGAEHDGACVVNQAHIALVGRPIEHP